jgi:TonB-linked SusC/RagA family outer membrane protein
LQLAYSQNPLIGDPQSENELNQAYRMPTVIPVRDVNGGWAGTAAPGFNNPANPVAARTRQSSDYNRQANLNLFGNAYIEVDPIKNLTLRSSFGGAIGFGYGMQYNQRSYENAENPGNFQLNEGSGYGLDWTFTNTARYERKFDAHSVKVLVGYEAIKTGMGRGLSGSGLNPFSNSPDFIGLTNTSPTGRQLNSGPLQERTLASVFGRVDYNWNEKYYLSATVRRDGSSAFGIQSRYGTFPAISGAWRISSESFMQDVKWIDDLKLRGGWGIMGNQNINPTNQFALGTSNPGVGYDISGSNSSVLPGFIPAQPGNLKGQWEENITTNIGLDGTFLNGTMEVILEFWQKNTDKLLFAPNIPNTAGVFVNNPVVNIASMVNKGIDLQIIKRIKVNNDWSLVLDGNISPLQNKITSIDPSNPNQFFDVGNFRNVQFVRNAVGQPISSFFGYRTLGYFQNAADVTNSPTQDGAGPGRFKFQDTNGDGKITPDDRIYMGSPVPDFTYGFNATVKYKNWSLDAFFYGKSGNQIVNFSKWYTGFYQSFSGAGLSAITLDSWTPEKGNSASTPIIETASNFSTNTQANSWYVEDGSYLRLRNLQINYNVPSNILNKFGAKSLRVFVQGTNLFTITKYTGKDPEVASNVDTVLGVDIGNFPATQIWSLGLHLGF